MLWLFQIISPSRLIRSQERERGLEGVDFHKAFLYYFFSSTAQCLCDVKTSNITLLWNAKKTFLMVTLTLWCSKVLNVPDRKAELGCKRHIRKATGMPLRGVFQWSADYKLAWLAGVKFHHRSVYRDKLQASGEAFLHSFLATCSRWGLHWWLSTQVRTKLFPSSNVIPSLHGFCWITLHFTVP